MAMLNAPPKYTMEDEIKRMYENRIAELEKSIMSALEKNTKARNLVKEIGCNSVEPLLLVVHDHLLVAANTVHAVKEYSPCLEIKSSKA